MRGVMVAGGEKLRKATLFYCPSVSELPVCNIVMCNVMVLAVNNLQITTRQLLPIIQLIERQQYYRPKDIP